MKKIISVFLAFAFLLTSFLCLAYAGNEEKTTFKNIIFMIGDGMGSNHLEWTKAEKGVELFMDTLPYQGYRTTDSLNGTTDSAAGGTSLACGLRAFNSNVGTLSILNRQNVLRVANYLSLTEAAAKMGKKTGIVTTDTNNGATPAAFSVHVEKREYADEINSQQLKTKFDLIWSHSSGISEETVTNAGWAYVDDINDISALPEGTRSFAQFSGKMEYVTGAENDAPLSILTNYAIDKLDNDNGFFLMIEGAHIDKNSHENKKEGMMKSLIEFDKAIKNAVEFAEKDGDTLVIVTADHETGAIVYNEKTAGYEFTSYDHSSANVPLRIYGSSGLVTENGQVIECVVPSRFVAKAMGYNGIFPFVSFNYMFLFDGIKFLIGMIING